jgi:hypothetical protein
VPLAVLAAAIAISLLYLLVWTLRMVVSHRTRIAFKNEGRPFWAAVLVVLLLWAGWLFVPTNPQLHTVFQGLAVLATIFFGIGAYAAYVTLPRAGEAVRPDVDSVEGCLELLFSFFF